MIDVGGELLLGGAYSDSVFKSNSDFCDFKLSNYYEYKSYLS